MPSFPVLICSQGTPNLLCSGKPSMVGFLNERTWGDWKERGEAPWGNLVWSVWIYLIIIFVDPMILESSLQSWVAWRWPCKCQPFIHAIRILAKCTMGKRFLVCAVPSFKFPHLANLWQSSFQLHGQNAIMQLIKSHVGVFRKCKRNSSFISFPWGLISTLRFSPFLPVWTTKNWLER